MCPREVDESKTQNPCKYLSRHFLNLEQLVLMRMHPQVIGVLNGSHFMFVLVCIVKINLWCPRASLHVCRCNNCHLVALEEDSTIFKHSLYPLCDPLLLLTCNCTPHTTSHVYDKEHIWKVAKQSCISKHVSMVNNMLI